MAHLLPYLIFRNLLLPQTEGNIVIDIQMGEQGIILKHRVDLPLVGRQLADVLPVKQDLSPGGLFKSRDHPQNRRLPAAGGPEKCHKLSLFYRQIEILDDRLVRFVALFQMPKFNDILRIFHKPLCVLSLIFLLLFAFCALLTNVLVRYGHAPHSNMPRRLSIQ